MSDQDTNLVPLIIAQYELKGHPTRTEHWNFVVLTSKAKVCTLEVRGNTDSFTFVPDPNAAPLNRIIPYRGGCHIADIPADSIDDLTERLREVPIVRHDLSWDCQVWVLAGVKLLKSDGIVPPHVDEGFIRDELSKDMANWEEAEDTVDERLLQNRTLDPDT